MRYESKDATIIFRTVDELKLKLEALSWAMGYNGNISSVLRAVLRQVIPQYVDNLKPDQKKEYETTLEHLQKKKEVKQTVLLGQEQKKEKQDGTADNGTD